MVITTYTNFTKKRNSTKRPTTGTDINCVLKDSTSIHEPIFELQRLQNIDSVTYIKWASRYYFVTDIVYVTNDIIDMHCKLDCLATYKNAILGSTQYVERSASEFNGDIIDHLNSPTLDFFQQTTRYALSDLHFSTTGCYILCILGFGVQQAIVPAVGASQVYALTTAEMTAFVSRLMTTSILQQLVDEFTNPADALIFCKWIPININYITGITSEIFCGTTDMQTTAKLITTRYMETHFAIQSTNLYFSQPPIADFSVENYLQQEPYSNAIMYLPFVGDVKFPLATTYKTTRTIQALLDLFTGDIIYNFYTSANSTWFGNCAFECPIGRQQTNWKGVIQAVVEFVGMSTTNLINLSSAGMTNASAIALNEKVQKAQFYGNTLPRGITALTGALEVHSQHGGAYSSALSAYSENGTDIVITTYSKVPAMGVSEMNSLYGRPLYAVRNLSALSGYVKCNGAVLDISAEYNERKELEYFLDSGFYIE